MRMPIDCIRSSCGPILAHPPCFFKNLLQQYPPFTAHFPTKILYLSAISSSFHCTNGTGRCPGGSWPTYFRATVPVDLETWLRRYEDAAKKDIPLRVAFCFDHFVDDKKDKIPPLRAKNFRNSEEVRLMHGLAILSYINICILLAQDRTSGGLLLVHFRVP
jgi:hypothetical protein